MLNNATGKPNDRGSFRPKELSCGVHLIYPDSSKFIGTLVGISTRANPRIFQLKPSRNDAWMLFMADGTHLLIDRANDVSTIREHRDGFSTDNNWTGKVEYENGDLFEGKMHITYDPVGHKWSYSLTSGTLTYKDGTTYSGTFRNNKPSNAVEEKDNSSSTELAKIEELIKQGETEKACEQLNALWLKSRDKEVYMLKRKHCQ